MLITNIHQSMLKLKTHSDFHDLFLNYFYFGKKKSTIFCNLYFHNHKRIYITLSFEFYYVMLFDKLFKKKYNKIYHKTIENNPLYSII
jgi:hypothetical protein